MIELVERRASLAKGTEEFTFKRTRDGRYVCIIINLIRDNRLDEARGKAAESFLEYDRAGWCKDLPLGLAAHLIDGENVARKCKVVGLDHGRRGVTVKLDE